MSQQLHSSGARLLLAGLARTVLVTVVGLLTWSVLPTVLGWAPTVVMSGSMEPRIRTGDIVVTRPVAPEDLKPGQVLLADDPTRPEQRLLHRYDHTTDRGRLVLRGDANTDVDSTPVTPNAVHGVGTLRIPWLGQPAVWAAHGRYLLVALTALGLLALLALARIRDNDPDDDVGGDGGDGGLSQPTASHTETGDSSRNRVSQMPVGVAMVLAATGLLTGIGTPAAATFSATTTGTTSFTAATAPIERTTRIEAETLVPAARGTAPVEVQHSCCGAQFSAGAQLWFRATRVGDHMTTTFQVPRAGIYELSAQFTQARDYGRLQISIDGNPVGQRFDGYRPLGVASSGPISWGTLDLNHGPHQLTITITGKRLLSTGYFAGLDRFDLTLL